MKNPQDKRDADADALRDLAGASDQADGSAPPTGTGGEPDPVDVLAAMAEGAEEQEADAPKPPDEQEELDEELLAAVGHEIGEGGVDPADLADLSANRLSAAERKARAAVLHSQAAQAHHHQFKRTMIPLLIVVAGMLFVLGAVVAAILPGREQAGRGGILSGLWAWVAVWVSFPLGAILLFGAWFFHREVRLAEEADRAEEAGEEPPPQDEAPEGEVPQDKPQDES